MVSFARDPTDMSLRNRIRPDVFGSFAGVTSRESGLKIKDGKLYG